LKQSARWIWQKTNYPHFTYDAKSIEPLVQSISREQGYLIAFTRFLNDETLRMRQWESLSSEVLNSSAIEGEILNRESVRASVGRKLGLANIEQSRVIDTHTDGIIDILIDANTHYEGDLTLERLFGWHNALFPRGYSGFEKIIVADFRGSSKMEVVSGAIGREKVHYVAPPSDTLKDEMNAFLNWFNKQDSTLIKAAIAHLWFVVIHPFDDGDVEQQGGVGLADGLADIIIISNVLFQAKSMYTLALEAKRILKQSGRIMIIEWSESFGGLGPQPVDVVPIEEVKRTFGSAGLVFVSEFPAGEHHYGLIFSK
jgi:hypothetical protein